MTSMNLMDSKNEELTKELKLVGKDPGNKGLRKVIQNGNKDMTPKKYSSVAISGSFKIWAREIRDYARMADPKTLDLLDLGEREEENIDLDEL